MHTVRMNLHYHFVQSSHTQVLSLSAQASELLESRIYMPINIHSNTYLHTENHEDIAYHIYSPHFQNNESLCLLINISILQFVDLHMFRFTHTESRVCKI